MSGTKRVLQTIEAHWSSHSEVSRRYLLTELIGRGGHGEVWQAQDLQTPGRILAIKRLLPGIGMADSQIRFRVEIDALQRLGQHPHIVSLHGYGEHYGQPYLVMDYVRGYSLAMLIRHWQRQLPAARPDLRTIGYVLEALALALHHVHAHGILHRDVKPSNVLIGYENGVLRVRLCDFGIARVGPRGITQPGERLGTDEYMSPEQASSAWAPMTPASDLFSLAVVAMELLTLQASSPDGTPYSNYVVNHWARLPSQLFRMWPGIPGKLVSLLTLALAPRLEDRTPHAARLLQQLREVFSSEVHFV